MPLRAEASRAVRRVQASCPVGKTLPQGRFTRPEEVKKIGGPHEMTISWGDKRNKNAELSRRALDILAGLEV